MPKFRKKPVVIEAWQWHGEALKVGDPDWVAEATEPVVAVLYGTSVTALKIHTLEGVMKASPGDWIIRGVMNEIYSCKPDIFEATYEPVDEEESPLDELQRLGQEYDNG